MNKLHIRLLGRFVIVVTLVYGLSVSTLRGVLEVRASAISPEPRSKENEQTVKLAKNKTYNDIDRAWTYEGHWSKEKTKRAFGGQFHTSHTIQDYATISVEGSEFTLIYSTAPNYGELDVFVDDLKIHTINQNKSKTSYQEEWTSPELELGIHVLKFVHASGKLVNIDAVKIRGPKPIPSSQPTSFPTFAATPTIVPSEFPTASPTGSLPAENPTPLPTEEVSSPTPSPISSFTATATQTQIVSSTPSLVASFTTAPTQTQVSSPSPSFTASVVASLTSTVTIMPSPTVTNSPPTTQASGKIYYVSPNGSGTSCSSNTPCSLSSGLDKLAAGDTLYLKSGVYLQSSKVSISKSGTANARITITKDPQDADPAIISGDVNGNGKVDQTDGPRTSGANQYTPLVQVGGSYVTIKNIEIAFSAGRGIQTSGSNHILSGLNVHHTWEAAVKVYSSYTLVENNQIWRGAEINYCGGANGSRGCNGNWPGGLSWGESSGSTAPGLAHHITIRGNLVYNISGEGILCMHSDYATVENNVVFDNWAADIDIDKCSYVTLSRNLVYYTADKVWWRYTDRPSNGIMLSNEFTKVEGVSYPLGHDRLITNNIIVGAGVGFRFWPGEGGAGDLDQSRLINDVIANNSIIESQNGKSIDIDEPIAAGLGHTNTRLVDNLILQSSGTLASVDTVSGLTFDHNLWSQTPPSNVLSPSDIIGNPQLMDSSHTRLAGSVVADWYKLTSNSPAIHKGTYLSQIILDYFGTTRSNPPSIGAHEYKSIP